MSESTHERVARLSTLTNATEHVARHTAALQCCFSLLKHVDSLRPTLIAEWGAHAGISHFAASQLRRRVAYRESDSGTNADGAKTHPKLSLHERSAIAETDLQEMCPERRHTDLVPFPDLLCSVIGCIWPISTSGLP